MSNATFDPNKIRVEDIFRAKEERRQRLAKLPFEEKIKIVKRLQTSVSAALKNEKLIFESFLKACPDFAGEPLQEWDVVDGWYAKRAIASPPHPYDKRPDIIAITASGKRIGVELKSWVNRDQITVARKQERIRDNILKAIGEQPPNETQHIGCVWLNPKEVRFDARDAADFRHQMFALIQEVDDKWSKKAERDQNYRQDESDFSGSPILEKYLDGARFFPANLRHLKIRWIRFPDRSTFYSPSDMRETLGSTLIAHKTDERYKDLRKHVGLDEVYLLVHYDFKAFAYNTPFDAPNFGFKEAAAFASSVLDGDRGYFDRIFLFHFLWSEEEAYRIL
jgi:hypothetical protein